MRSRSHCQSTKSLHASSTPPRRHATQPRNARADTPPTNPHQQQTATSLFARACRRRPLDLPQKATRPLVFSNSGSSPVASGDAFSRSIVGSIPGSATPFWEFFPSPWAGPSSFSVSLSPARDGPLSAAGPATAQIQPRRPSSSSPLPQDSQPSSSSPKPAQMFQIRPNSLDDGSDGSDEYDYYLYFRLCFQARLTGTSKVYAKVHVEHGVNDDDDGDV